MKFSAAAVLLTSALGVSAHPSGHPAHRHAHRSLEAREFVMYNKPVPPPAPEPTTSTEAPPPPPKPTSTSVEVVEAAAKAEPTSTKKAEPKPSPKPEEDEEEDDNTEDSAADKFEKATKLKDAGLGISSYSDFCGGAKSKRATLENIMYAGNVGTSDNYGCNWMMIDGSLVDKYDNVVRVENIDDSDYSCVAYLKVGPDGGINGFFQDNQVFKFTLPGGTVQHVAADADTQGGIICDKGSIGTTKWGEFTSTWAELDFDSTPNDGWSGGDASCLTSTRNGFPVPGLRMCGHGECSTIWPGGKGENAFTEGMEEQDGWGLNIVPGEVRVTVTYGFTG